MRKQGNERCSAKGHHRNNSRPKTPASPVVEDIKVNVVENNVHEIPNSTLPKTKRNKKDKKRKIKKDSTEDFVFPKRTTRPISSAINEPIATTNSFSDLETEDKQPRKSKKTSRNP
ncbi:hypothetical protein TNCV_1434521 [Trichonephila clavipes]|nr:hypothetical protein TNCV_1434521 [Trichonephila clavipes]